MKTHLSENISRLPPHLRHLKSILSEDLSPDIAVQNAKSGQVTISFKDKLIHSAYNPLVDAEKFCKGCKIAPDDTILCYGFGLGYHIEAILKRLNSEGRLLVIELNLDILNAAFVLRDLGAILEHPRVRLIHHKGELEALKQLDHALNNFLPDTDAEKQIVVHTPSFKSMPSGYEKIRNLFDVVLMEKAVPVVHHDQSQKNLTANIEAIITSPGVADVLSIISYMPCFVISAGPSLDEALPYLKKYQHAAWIFAVDTALPAIESCGVRPDFLVTVDPQPESMEHFDGHWNCRVPLIFIPTANAGVIAHYKGPKMVAVQKNHSVAGAIEHLLAGKGFTESGSSSACIALDLVSRFGGRPLILAGQDCAFPGMKIYSANVAKTRGWLNSTNRLNTLEMIHRQAAASEEIIYVKDKYGCEIPTHKNLFSYLKEIERIVAAHEDVQFYNLLSHGVKIKGVQDLLFVEELEDILKNPISKEIEVRRLPLDKGLKREILDRLSIRD